MKKPLLIAALAGVLAFLFSALYLSSVETKYKTGAQMVKVLVSKDYINQGTMIEPSMVEERKVPKEFLQPKTLQSLKELLNIEGKTVFISLAPIEKGEQILTTKLSMLGIDTGISAIIPSGKRAFMHTFDSTQVSGIIKPGNKVDIVAVVDAVSKEGGHQQISKTILQNILVLSVGKDILGAVKKEAQSNSERFVPASEGGQVAVSFALTPAEGELLSLSSENGKIFMALRSMGDNSTNENSDVKLSNISKDMTGAVKAADPNNSAEYLKAVQKQQNEAMGLLKKYQKR
jgi:pilus assembly protein CpaB